MRLIVSGWFVDNRLAIPLVAFPVPFLLLSIMSFISNAILSYYWLFVCIPVKPTINLFQYLSHRNHQLSCVVVELSSNMDCVRFYTTPTICSSVVWRRDSVGLPVQDNCHVLTPRDYRGYLKCTQYEPPPPSATTTTSWALKLWWAFVHTASHLHSLLCRTATWLDEWLTDWLVSVPYFGLHVVFWVDAAPAPVSGVQYLKVDGVFVNNWSAEDTWWSLPQGDWLAGGGRKWFP